jgi:allene oxide cyclase
MSSSSVVIHVIEHAPPPNMRMVGDVLTFANPIFDGRDVNMIGRDQGFCLDITLTKSSECVWTTILPGGQISAEGPLSDTKTSLVAITGGTGKYQAARGWAEEKAHNEAGTKFDVIFHLSG